MAINHTTLWTRIGKFCFAGNTIQTALQTTIEDEVEDAIQQLGGTNALEHEAIREGVLTALRSLQSSGSSAVLGTVKTPVQRLLIQTIKDDEQQPTDSLSDALAELIRQMDTASESLDASTPGASVAYAAANTGTGVLVFDVKRPDGKVNEHIYAEAIEGVVTASPSTGLATISLTGEVNVGETSYDWPLGSGASSTITSHTAASGTNVILTGGMESEDTNSSNLPSSWIASVATLGTTVKMTPVEVQTVVISGGPTGGYYLLHFTDRDAKQQTTIPLAYNASGTDVQTALRSLQGLGSITIVTTGTSPAFTHTITFTGVPNPAELTSTNAMTGGTPVVTHATTTAGSANVMRGARALELDSDAAELTTLQVPVTVSAETQYAVNIWALADVPPAAGVITVELVDAIGGTVIKDDKGMRNTVHFNAADLTTSFKSLTALIANANEVQSVSLTGGPTGGTFTLTFDGQTTGAIAYNATAATVKTALEALSNIAVDDIATAGGPLPAAVTVTFQNALGNRDVVEMTGDGTSLTGGAAPAVAISTTTNGNSARAVFRTPTVLPTNVYFRVRISTAVSAGTSVFIDEFVMVPVTEFYTGGIWFAAFTGLTRWAVDDRITVTVTNDRAGALHEWANRIFDLRASGLLLPTNMNALESQSDALIV